MSTPSKGIFAFLQDLPEYQGLPENNTKQEIENNNQNNNNECTSDFKNAFDEIKKMNNEKDELYTNNVNFYKDKCQIL
jgi:hypothetical protein